MRESLFRSQTSLSPGLSPGPNLSANSSMISSRSMKIVISMVITLGACESSSGDLPKLPEPGELNGGTFRYECLGQSDASPTCTNQRQFPIALAVGGRFGLDYFPDASGQTLPQLASASPARLAEHASGYFTMLAPGYTAVLVLNGGVVMDIKHLRAASIDHLQVNHSGDTLNLIEIDLAVDSKIRLEVRPYESYSDQPLAGSMEYQWTSGNPGMIAITSDQNSRQIELTGVNPGETTISVNTGQINLTMPVRISEVDSDEEESESSTSGDETTTAGSEGPDTGGTTQGSMPYLVGDR